MKKRFLTYGTMILSSLLIFTGCSNSSSSYSSGSEHSVNSFASDGINMSNNYDYGEEITEMVTEGEQEISTIDTEEHNLKIIKTGRIKLETTQYEETTSIILKTIKEMGGFVENSYSDGNISNRNMELTIRLPKAKFDEFMNQKYDNVTVLSNSINTKDITSTYVDNETQLKSLQIRQERLLGYLEKAEKLEDLFAIEKELASVNYEIDMIQGTLNNYDNLVEYSTINVSIYEVVDLTIVQEDNSFKGEVIKTIKNTLQNIKELFEHLTLLVIRSLIVGALVMLPLCVVILVIKKIFKTLNKKKIQKLNKKNKKNKKNDKNDKNE